VESRKDIFVLLVQTGALSKEIIYGSRQVAMSVVYEAVRLPEQYLPRGESLCMAAIEFVGHFYSDLPAPDWYRRWTEERRRG
jgi:hypothetical protein